MERTDPSSRPTRLISVGGGKGGVGKSIVSTNLAVTIAQAGHDVILCDLDLGAANLHLLLGLSSPRPGIVSLLSAESGPAALEAALTPTQIPRLRLLAGTGGTVAAANITHGQKLRILRKLRALRADYVVVDVGAGVNFNALDFFELGSQRIIVATPQVTSMHDAYAFLKGAVLRTLRHHAARSPQAALLEPAMATREGERVRDLLLRIRQEDAEFGDKVEHILAHFGAYLIGNQLIDGSQVGVLNAVSKMVEDYLGIALPILGWIPGTPRVSESVNDRLPLMARQGQLETREVRAFRGIVDALLAGDGAPEEELLLELVEEGNLPTGFPLDPEAPEVDSTIAAVTAARVAQATPPPPPPAASGVPTAVAPERSPPPLPVAARAPAPPPLDYPQDDDLPVPVKPRIYVRPGRKRPPEGEDQKRKRALDSAGRRRKITLPGMPPGRR